jgi:hypothetical protein
MKASDIVSRNNGKNVFAIMNMSITADHQSVTLVEVNPEDTRQHLYPNNEPTVISIKELEAFYEVVRI